MLCTAPSSALLPDRWSPAFNSHLACTGTALRLILSDELWAGMTCVTPGPHFNYSGKFLQCSPPMPHHPRNSVLGDGGKGCQWLLKGLLPKKVAWTCSRLALSRKNTSFYVYGIEILVVLLQQNSSLTSLMGGVALPANQQHSVLVSQAQLR